MNNKCKVIALLLVTSMLLAMLPVSSIEEYQATEKVSEELLEVMDVTYEDLSSGNFVDSGETYTCVIWLEDVELEEAVETGIDAAEMTKDNYSTWSLYNYPYTTYEVEGLTYVDVTLDENVDEEYVQTYIETEREVATELYAENNNSFVAENFMARDMSVTYVSRYSPCIFADLSISKVVELTEAEEVVSIGYTYEVEAANAYLEYYGTATLSVGEIQEKAELIRADEARDDYNVTGEGVKIGQLEYYYPSVDTVNVNPSIDEITPNESAHPDNVYSIMTTIAPNATYYATGQFSHLGSFYAQIEWLLDQGVNIINHSAALGYDVNTYTNEARWLDHIAFNHDVHFVQSSGNSMGLGNTSDGITDDNGEDGVLNPGMAYNIITVGNVKEENGIFQISPSSSYNHNGLPITTYKPDIVAPGVYQYTGGTSYSAPVVSGVIALMCEYKPALKTKQHIVKAILAATTSKNSIKHVTEDEEFEVYGAGMIDARSAIYAIYKGNYSTSTGALVTVGSSKSYTMKVTSSDTLMRVALAYANRIEYDEDDETHSISNVPNGVIGKLDIKVYDPNGNLVASIISEDLEREANLKILEFKPNGVYGNYTIEVIVATRAVYADNTTINFGVAWR